MDNSEKARFTLRVSRELLDKLECIASYYGRTKNKELEQMILARIKTFENKHGPITTTDKQED